MIYIYACIILKLFKKLIFAQTGFFILNYAIWTRKMRALNSYQLYCLKIDLVSHPAIGGRAVETITNGNFHHYFPQLLNSRKTQRSLV